MMNIIRAPDPRLGIKSDQVPEPIDQKILNEMHKLMLSENGIGLAGIQVNIPTRFFIIDIGDGLEVYINPQVLKYTGNIIKSTEGCLSFPGLVETVDRHSSLIVSYTDNETGALVAEELDALRAIVFQHENDHLDGITIDKQYLFQPLNSL